MLVCTCDSKDATPFDSGITTKEIQLKDIQSVRMVHHKSLEFDVTGEGKCVFEAESSAQCNTWMVALHAVMTAAAVPSLKERVHRERGELLILNYNMQLDVNRQQVQQWKVKQRRNTIEAIGLKYNLNTNTV